MKLQYLKEFIVLVDLQNFTKASNKLFLTPSALTRHINYIESELGINLIIRNTHEFEITPFGKKVYETFKNILDSYDQLLNSINNYNKCLEGHLRIGMLYYSIELLTMPFIEKFSKKYPQIELGYFSCQPHQMMTALMKNQIDIGIVFKTDNMFLNDLIFNELVEFRFIAIMSDRNQYCQSHEIFLSELSNCNIILFSEDTYTTDIMKILFDKCGFEPQNIVYTENIDTVSICINQTNAIFITTENLTDVFKNFKIARIKDEELRLSCGYACKINNSNPVIPLFLKEIE